MLSHPPRIFHVYFIFCIIQYDFIDFLPQIIPMLQIGISFCWLLRPLDTFPSIIKVGFLYFLALIFWYLQGSSGSSCVFPPPALESDISLWSSDFLLENSIETNIWVLPVAIRVLFLRSLT